MTTDPLAEVSRRWSPYVYGENNPIKMIDLDGMRAVYNWNNGTYEDGGKEVSWGEVQEQYGIGQQSGGQDPPIRNKYVTIGGHVYRPYGNGLYKPIDEGVIKNDYTFESMYIGGKIFGPIFGYFGRTIGGWFGEKTALKEAIVAIGELTGKGYTATELSELLSVKDGDIVKIIYRGMTGNEMKGAGLYLADEAEYAAGYASNGATTAEAVAIPHQNFQYLIKEGLIKTVQGVNSKTNQKGIEYLITNPVLKQKVLDILLKTASGGK